MTDRAQAADDPERAERSSERGERSPEHGERPIGAYSVDAPKPGEIVVRVQGAWRLRGHLPNESELQRALANGAVKRVTFDASALEAWDSALLVFLVHAVGQCRAHSIDVDVGGLPPGVKRLLALAEATPLKLETEDSRPGTEWLARVGEHALALRRETLEYVAFVGECALGVGRLLRGKSQFRVADFFYYVQQAGAEALPIVTLIAVLVGLIMGFVGAVQLQRFGASIFIADLVGLATTREMGAMMTAIIMSGRTGAAYAAQLGTMKVTEEIDALTTLGIAPIDFLVLPRILALFVMMPLLCLYADLVGILGGSIVATGMLHLTALQYFEQMTHAVTITQVSIGVVKSALFGILVALSGCYHGTRCELDASSVGDATTASVVMSIVFIVASDGLMAVLCNVLNI
jgi:phospholipid/cholesterol/gamma-HCH transport system permease protein